MYPTQHLSSRRQPMRDQVGPVRVFLVDDHEMVREAMATALGTYESCQVVGVAGSLAEASAALPSLNIDVVVTDLDLGDGLGTELVGRLDGTIPVLLITGTEERKGLQAALDSGCVGFVSKASDFDVLVSAVLSASRGTAVFPAELLGSILHAGPSDLREALTNRELDVLNRLARADSVATIATEAHLSPHTVRNHIKQILSKLGARSQLEAVVVGVRAGIVTID